MTSRHRVSTVLALASLSLLGGESCWGGTDPALHGGRRLTVTESQLDTENRYPFAVMIKAPLRSGGTRMCSGVLIHSRLALTAAHCVCGIRRSAAPSEGTRLIIDGSTCAESVTVTTVVYHPSRTTDSDHRGHDGKVRPHKDFRIVLDAQGNVLENSADLAVIHLEESLKQKEFQPVSVATDKVWLNDSVVLVGYGYDKRTHGYSGDRRSGNNQVTAVETSGKTFLVGRKGSHTLGGDSGGPCLREGMLVGIATTSSEPPVEFSEFTSTHFYKQWLDEEIAQARKKTASVGTQAP